MNADEMTKRFAAGGESAEEAFFEVVNALNNMDDPIAKNTAAVNLFGTQFEDLQANVLPVLAGMKDGAAASYDALSQINEINMRIWILHWRERNAPSRVCSFQR